MLTRAKVQSVFKEARFKISEVVYIKNDLKKEHPLVIHSRELVESITGTGMFMYCCVHSNGKKYLFSEHLLSSVNDEILD